MKIILVGLLSILFFNKNFAQIVERNDKVLKLPKYTIADFPKKAIPIKSIQFVQMLNDSVNFGYAQKGLDNQVVQVKLAKPATSFFQDHINKMYENDYKKNGGVMLWVLKELRVGEKTNAFKQYSYIKFKAETYIQNSENKFTAIFKIDTIYANGTTGDATQMLATEIEDLLRLLMRNTFTGATSLAFSINPTYTFEEIINTKKLQIIHPILNDEIYNEGAYLNFNEFLQNKPSITGFETIVSKKKKAQSITIIDSKKDTIQPWGICKNGELYKYEEDELIPLEKQKDGFIISDYVEKVSRKNGNVFIGTVIGGLAGALITSSNKSNKTFLVKNIASLSKAKMQPEATCIDMENGALTF